MLKLDNNLLNELGLGGLPEDQKKAMLQHIYETLELRVGTNLANQMTDQQLEEFEKFIDDGGDANQAQALQWLESNLPNYKQVVNEVFEALKAEVRAMAPQIMASSGAQPGAQAMGPGMNAPAAPLPAPAANPGMAYQAQSGMPLAMSSQQVPTMPSQPQQPLTPQDPFAQQFPSQPGGTPPVSTAGYPQAPPATPSYGQQPAYAGAGYPPAPQPQGMGMPPSQSQQPIPYGSQPPHSSMPSASSQPAPVSPGATTTPQPYAPAGLSQAPQPPMPSNNAGQPTPAVNTDYPAFPAQQPPAGPGAAGTYPQQPPQFS
jgi:hypothetical protein